MWDGRKRGQGKGTVEPLPQTEEALLELTRFGDDTLAMLLSHISLRVEQIVPEVVGLSLSLAQGDLTFTMTATSVPVAPLDAVQHLGGGPFEEALRTGQTHTYQAEDMADEELWRLFARATAAAGVESTLSLPILGIGEVIAGVNLYASTPDAFDGHHEELAEACGAWAGGATTNADLDFTTRFKAAATPDRLRAENLRNQAVGALMSWSGVSAEEADRRLHDAAERAGISDEQLARGITELLEQRPSDQ